MRYLEKSFQLLFKCFLILVPTFAALAIPALIQGVGAANALASLYGMINMANAGYLVDNPWLVFQLALNIISAVVGGSFVAFILNFIDVPSTAGMVNKALETGVADLQDFVPSLKGNFAKYLLYWLGTIVLSLILGFAGVILFLLFSLLAGALGSFGLFLLILAIIAMALAGFVISILLSFWFPSMVVDDLGVVDGFKKSIEVARSYFWPLLGITLLVAICSSIVSGILSFIGLIPILGPVILAVIPAFTAVLLTTFYFSVYRDKTGKGEAFIA